MMIAIPSFKPGQLVEEYSGSEVLRSGSPFATFCRTFWPVFSSCLLSPSASGDQIVVAGFEGIVENIETRATFLKMYDGRRVVIPNSTLFTESVTVNTAFDHAPPAIRHRHRVWR